MRVVLLILFVPNVSALVQLFLQKFLVVTLLGYRANWFVSFDVFMVVVGLWVNIFVPFHALTY